MNTTESLQNPLASLALRDLDLDELAGDGAAGAMVSLAAGLGTTVSCMAGGGVVGGPAGWGGCALAGVLVGVGTYIL